MDLRAEGYGQRYVLGGVPPHEGAREQAIHAAYALLFRLRGGSPGGGPPSRAQEILPGTATGAGGLDGGCLFRFAIDEWLARQQWATAGGERWGRTYAATVRRELGGVRIMQFEPPAGDDLLLTYVRGLREAGRSIKSRANRLSIIGRVLTFCRRRGWLVGVPEMPRAAEAGEKARTVDVVIYTEAMFRTLREGIFGRSDPASASLASIGGTEAERLDYIARRRLYLSWAFYTGMHTADLDALTAEAVAIDFGVYIRTNSKSARWIKPEQFDMPEGLLADCRAELARLGRPWRPGEPICGGKWGRRGVTVSKRTTARLGLPAWDFRTVARRSCIWHYALLGWSERDMSEILGHVDQKMIRTVYLRVPTRMRSPMKVPWTIDNVATTPWRLDRAKSAPVIRFVRPAAAEGNDDE